MDNEYKEYPLSTLSDAEISMLSTAIDSAPYHEETSHMIDLSLLGDIDADELSHTVSISGQSAYLEEYGSLNHKKFAVQSCKAMATRLENADQHMLHSPDEYRQLAQRVQNISPTTH